MSSRMLKAVEMLHQSICEFWETMETEDFSTYLNEQCSEEVKKAYPFKGSLDEELNNILNWLDEIENDR